VHACEIPVLALENGSSRAGSGDAGLPAALESDGCDAIVLGCAGMAELCADISAAIGVPVVDGVAAGTLLVQSLVALGLVTGARRRVRRRRCPSATPACSALSAVSPVRTRAETGPQRLPPGSLGYSVANHSVTAAAMVGRALRGSWPPGSQS
jgi:hypothetical protein